MSAGAVFKLLANDGKADGLIMATALLNTRIQSISQARAKAGVDKTPTLKELEVTHILYVSAHYKPFAAIGYEYSKVRPTSGNPTLGSGVQFSIPQFGDFFHDMVCRVRLNPVAATPTTYTAVVTNVNGSAFRVLDAFNNVVLPVNAQNTPVNGNTMNGSTFTGAPLVRYCEFPGNRVFSSVKFEVNGNPLDQYDDLVPTMLEKFCVAPNKRVGYNRLVGQENSLTGYGGLRAALVTDQDTTSAGAFNTPAAINRNTAGQSNQTVALFGTTTAAGTTAVAGVALNAGTQYDVSRQLLQVVNGPQTPKFTQPALELWHKLRFWFCDDVRLSIPSVAIPFGQRYITMELAAASSLIYTAPTYFLETTSVFAGASLDGQAAVTTDAPISGNSDSTTTTRTYTPLVNPVGALPTTIGVDKIELYINNIFVNPEIHDIYIKRIGFSLIRVYREQISRSNVSTTDDKLLSNLKWPIEYMFVGLRPVFNGSATNANQWRDWHRMTRMVDAVADSPSLATTNYWDGNDASITTSSVGRIQPDRYWLPVPSCDTLTLTSHGITIFDTFGDSMFNAYLPLQYGGAAVNTPEDPGALLVNMSLFPRAYQPSGHINISRARETYLKWTSSYSSSASPVDMIVVAVAINFLLISDGSAVLRYST